MFPQDVIRRLNTMTGDFQAVVSQTEEVLEKAIKGAKIPDTKTIGSVIFDGGMDPTEFIKQIDPKNLAGSIPFALELVERMKAIATNPEQLIQQIMGPNLFGLIQQIQAGLQQGLSMVEEMKQVASILSSQNSENKKKKKRDPKKQEEIKKKAKEHADKIKSGEV